MKLADVNVLVHAVDEEANQHDAARTWLEAALSGTETVAFAWLVLVGFVRVASNPAVMETPLATGEALAIVEEWLAQPPATIVTPTDRHPAVLRDLLAPLGAGGNLVPDAHLAALAVEHGATLVSFDNDFSRFPGLRWADPRRGA